MTHTRQDWEPPLSGSSQWTGSQQEPEPRRSGRWKQVLAALLGAVLLLAIGAFAGYLMMGQPSGRTPAGEAPASASADQASADLEPAPAAAAEDPSAAPAAAVTEAIGDWMLVCGSEATEGSCALQQRLADGEGNTELFWIIYRDAQGNIRSLWQMPPKVETAPGIAVDLGDGAPRTVPFEGCTETLCTVRATLAPPYVEQLKAASTVSAVVMLAADRRLVRYRLSANGLAEALPRLR